MPGPPPPRKAGRSPERPRSAPSISATTSAACRASRPSRMGLHSVSDASMGLSMLTLTNDGGLQVAGQRVVDLELLRVGLRSEDPIGQHMDVALAKDANRPGELVQAL